MSDDEIRALIALCEDAIATDNWARLWLTSTPSQVMGLDQDALRFRHITKGADHLRDTPRWGWSVQWGMWCDENMDLRAAIDADMGEAP